jgi:hypothetical protein
MLTRRAVLRLGSTVATVALAGGASIVGGTAHTYADVGAAASPRAAPTPERGVRIVAKPVVYVFPSTPRNGAAQFDVAVRLDQAPDPRSELRTTVTTPKGRLLAVSHRDARPIGSARRHCFVAGEVWDDTGVTHAVTRTARAIGATASAPGSEAGFRRLAARRLGCKA